MQPKKRAWVVGKKSLLFLGTVMQKNIFGLILTTLLASAPATTWAYNFNVSIDTSSLAGTNATLAFDFIDGDGVVNNTVELTDFLINGLFDPDLATLEGDVTRTNTSATFNDSSFLNELLAPVTLGNSISFKLQTTNQHEATGFLPDAFTFYILNETGSLSLFATSDTTGSGALFAIDLDGNENGLSVFTASADQPTWTVQPVPLPGAFSLMFAPLMAGIWTFRKRTNQSA